MLHCTVFFSDPTILGKVSQVINKVHSEIKIEKILDESQFKHLNSETHVLICDEESFTKLSLSIDEHQKFKKIIFIGETIEQYENTLTIAFKKIIIQLCSYLNETIEEMYKKEKYIPVPIYKFKLETNYPFDVFVSLSSEKYVKILHKDHEFQAQRLQKLTFNKVKYLYVKSEQYSEVKACLYTPPTKNSTVELVATELNAVEAVQQYMAEIGVDNKAIELTKKLHKDIEENHDHKFMKKLFARFKDMEGSFLYNHSYLTSVVALTAGAKFTWMTPDNKEKIYLGCMLHDLGYRNKDNALKESMKLSDIKKLPPEQRDDILNHPILFAKHLAQLDDVHQDVLKIVKDHHGVHNEESYPKPIYPAEINLIFALFIISHEFTLGLYAIAFNDQKIPTLLADICERFDKGNYRKIIPEFKMSIEETFLK